MSREIEGAMLVTTFIRPATGRQAVAERNLSAQVHFVIVRGKPKPDLHG